MPVFGTSQPQTLEAGRPALVWDDEDVVTTAPESCSASVGLQRNEYFPNCFSAEFKFAADPGAIMVDLQVADTNEDPYFVTKASFETGLNDAFVGRIEATNIVAKFVRLKMVTLTNAVKVTARFF
jgi:hypothetical protein